MENKKVDNIITCNQRSKLAKEHDTVSILFIGLLTTNTLDMPIIFKVTSLETSPPKLWCSKNHKTVRGPTKKRSRSISNTRKGHGISVAYLICHIQKGHDSIETSGELPEPIRVI